MRPPEPQGAGLQAGLHGAFMREGFDARPPVAVLHDTLEDLRLAVKDVFDVEGCRAGAGHPVWHAAQPVAPATAPAVRRLLEDGAQWVGKTVTDELTYSLAGINSHYGTPVNPAAPDRLPGGSSSGSAVAVAAGHADVALGTDCGGSVRLPASYCGLWGMRPTHGRLAANGCFTLAHSFDTVGWFARDGLTLGRVFESLSGSRLDEGRCAPVLRIATALTPLLDEAVRERFEADARALASLGSCRAEDTPLPSAQWANAFRVLQAAEVWQQHGAWFLLHGHSMGDDVRQRFERARHFGPDAVLAAQRVRMTACATLAALLGTHGGLLLTPTVPTTAPRLGDAASRVDDVRGRSQELLCLAGLAGLPQVSLPWAVIDGAPVGLSVIGARGDDEGVLAGARAIHAQLAVG